MDGKEVMLSNGIVSDKVGPAIFVLTIICNSYRDLILPLSGEDDVVRDAVMAAAARHLALHHSEWNAPGFKYHMAAIQGLVQRANGDTDDDLDGSITYSNLSTMVVLLIKEMMTGMKDYRILLTPPRTKSTDWSKNSLKKTSAFNATSSGGHILIGSFFVVRAECTNARDWEFAISQLQHIWRWTGFGNTLYAIETLQKIWSSQSGSRWTEVIVDQVDVFIM